MSVILLLLNSTAIFSQEEPVRPDTLPSAISLPDTLGQAGIKVSEDAVDLPITYKSEGYMKTDIVNKKVSLVGNAQVNYGTIELTADSIVLNMETGSVYATGRIDTAGKFIGKPHFKDGPEEFESKELTYNFKSKKGIIRNVTTEQEGGFLQSQTTKRHEDGSLHINKSKFTTCDAEEPHFYLALNKAKVYPGEKIVSGPAYLVVADIPLPVAVPFGFFPVQKKRASGIIMPRYGEEARRGYYLMGGGYYFALNDYFDLKLTGDIYTNGTWKTSTASVYRLRYRFSGNFSFSYANNVTGFKGDPEYDKSPNYQISWTHSQDGKANPGSTFSANVNMSSSGFDRNNSYRVADHVTTTRQSGINYSRTWAGTPFAFSASLRHSQNVQNKTIQLNLPTANFTVARFYPLKPKKGVVKQRWYHDLQTQYTASLDNPVSTYDSLLFTNQVFKNIRSGFKHEIPLSLQIRPFNNFSISPQLRYSGVLYTQKTLKYWNPYYFDPYKNDTVPSVVNDTIRGLFYGHALTPSLSASFNPTLYGTFQFKNKGGRLQAIRHVMRPSIGFSYTPSFNSLSSSLYQTVQYDTLGHVKDYSVFEGGIYGTPSLGKRNGSVSFSLANIVEAKMFARNDTTGKPKKVKIIDNLSLSTNYSIFADSLNWSPVSVSFRTTIAENINVQASSSFSIYGLSEKGVTVNELAYNMGMGLARMTSLNMSLDMDLGALLRDKDKTQQGASGSAPATGKVTGKQEGFTTKGDNLPLSNANTDEFGYARFDVPWSMRLAYNFTYSKPAFKTRISQTLTMNGDVRLTSKTAITYSTGYDFRLKQITMTNIGISRDLHCWEMSFNWVPVGYMRSWNFTIRAKAGILQDLKYERRKDFHENL